MTNFFGLFSDPVPLVLVFILIPLSILTSPLIDYISDKNDSDTKENDETPQKVSNIMNQKDDNEENLSQKVIKTKKQKNVVDNEIDESQEDLNEHDHSGKQVLGKNIEKKQDTNQRLKAKKLSMKEKLIFLVPYWICVLADWMQGPYVYEVYAASGWSKDQISILYITGYITSFALGTLIGTTADQIGRKRMILIGYCLVYSISCILTHFSSHLLILLFGRVLSGVAASVLATIFESWMISNYKSHCEEILYWKSYGSGIMAILSGFISYFGLILSNNRYTIAFDISSVCLLIGGILIYLLWNENYGVQEKTVGGRMSNAISLISKNAKLICLGISQSSFEASLFIFVFNWSPTLLSKETSFSLALVFSCFMVCIMIGSNLFSIARSRNMSSSRILVFIYCVSVIALSIPIYFSNFFVILIAFLLFEICCGVFWPTIGSLRGEHIPESGRSAIVNLFRMPTNLCVTFVVLYSGTMSEAMTYFSICLILGLGLISSLIFEYSTLKTKSKNSFFNGTKISAN